MVAGWAGVERVVARGWGPSVDWAAARAVVGWAGARVGGWVRDAVAWVAIVVADVATAGVGWALEVAAVAAVEGDWAVLGQRAACWEGKAADWGWAAQVAVARVVVERVAVRVVADWAGVARAVVVSVEAADWAVVATAVVERGMSRVCTGRVHTCHRLLHVPSCPRH